MMRLVLLAVAVAAIGALQLDAIPETVGLNSTRLELLSQWLQKQVNEESLPFVEAMIVKDGKLVYEFRSSNETEVKLTDQSVYEMYSQTKLITTIAVMICVDRGQINLDDPLELFIPEFKDAAVYISGEPNDMVTSPAKVKPTIRHALTHTSGILGYGMGALLGGSMHPTELAKVAQGIMAAAAFGVAGAATFIERYPSLEVYTATEAAYPLAFEPGSKHHYSHAHVHAARAVEVVTGMTFSEFVQKELFNPLQMEGAVWSYDCTKPDKLPVYAPDAAQIAFAGYDADGRMTKGAFGGLMKREHSAFATSSPHCGTTAFHDHGVLYFADAQLLTTIVDWVPVAKMLSPHHERRGTYNGATILSPETVELMWHNQLPDLAVGQIGHFLTDEVNDATLVLGGVGVGQGLGGVVMVDPALAQSPQSVGTWGWHGAATTQFVYDPVLDMSMMLFSQKMMGAWDSNYDPTSGRSPFHHLIYSALQDQSTTHVEL